MHIAVTSVCLIETTKVHIPNGASSKIATKKISWEYMYIELAAGRYAMGNTLHV